MERASADPGVAKQNINADMWHEHMKTESMHLHDLYISLASDCGVSSFEHTNRFLVKWRIGCVSQYPQVLVSEFGWGAGAPLRT